MVPEHAEGCIYHGYQCISHHPWTWYYDVSCVSVLISVLVIMFTVGGVSRTQSYVGIWYVLGHMSTLYKHAHTQCGIAHLYSSMLVQMSHVA